MKQICPSCPCVVHIHTQTGAVTDNNVTGAAAAVL